MTKLPTSQELQEDNGIESDTSIGCQYFKTKDPEWQTPKHVNRYLIDCLKGYEIGGRIDKDLWDSFQEDFEGWTEELFTLGYKRVQSILRDFLRDYGVYVSGPKYISQQLFTLAEEEKYKK